MGTLTKLLKAAISAALVNKAIRGSLAGGLVNTFGRFMAPATRARIISMVSGASRANPAAHSSPLATLIEAVIGLFLLRYTKIRWIAELVAFSGVGALLLKMLKKDKRDQGYSNSSKSSRKGQVIDVDDYSVEREVR